MPFILGLPISPPFDTMKFHVTTPKESPMPNPTSPRFATLGNADLPLMMRALDALLAHLRHKPDGTSLSPEDFFRFSVCQEDKETYLRADCLLSDLSDEAKRRTPRRTKSIPVNLPG